MTHTHYTPICRDEGGSITRSLAGPQRLGTHTIPRTGGHTSTARVVDIEPGRVLGWGNATAIGRVLFAIDGVAVGPAVLSLLS